MASTKISGLTTQTSVSSTDYVAVDNGNGAKKVAMSILASGIGTLLKLLGFGGIYIYPSQLGLTNSTVTLDELVSAMPGTISFLSTWSSQIEAIRQEINTKIGKSGAFGQLYVLRTGSVWYIAFSIYNTSEIYINKYTTINSMGYSGWTKLTVEDI